MDIAIITGASSGLGQVFAEKIVERYPALDEVWVIARREERLKEFAAKYPERHIRVLPLDLSAPQSFERLESILKEQQPNIKVLINNAGFDCVGYFRSMEAKNIYAMINLNVAGMTMMSRCCLPYMNQGSYQIIVGSEGAFVPLPMRAVYGASKTYGKFFARAIREEERSHGVNILFMPPGAMDTEMFRGNSPTKDFSSVKFQDLDKTTVAAMKKAEKGAGVYSPGFGTKLARVLCKMFPSAISTKIARLTQPKPEE